jgi:hypothetical protein
MEPPFPSDGSKAYLSPPRQLPCTRFHLVIREEPRGIGWVCIANGAVAGASRAGQQQSCRGRFGEMIRELFMAFLIVFLALAVTLWFASGPPLDVSQIEASLAK